MAGDDVLAEGVPSAAEVDAHQLCPAAAVGVDRVVGDGVAAGGVGGVDARSGVGGDEVAADRPAAAAVVGRDAVVDRAGLRVGAQLVARHCHARHRSAVVAEGGDAEAPGVGDQVAADGHAAAGRGEVNMAAQCAHTRAGVGEDRGRAAEQVLLDHRAVGGVHHHRFGKAVGCQTAHLRARGRQRDAVIPVATHQLHLWPGQLRQRQRIGSYGAAGAQRRRVAVADVRGLCRAVDRHQRPVDGRQRAAHVDHGYATAAQQVRRRGSDAGHRRAAGDHEDRSFYACRQGLHAAVVLTRAALRQRALAGQRGGIGDELPQAALPTVIGVDDGAEVEAEVDVVHAAAGHAHGADALVVGV